VHRESILDVRTLLQNNNLVLQQLAKRTVDLRRSYPKVRAVPSVLEAAFNDVASFNSLTNSSFTTVPFAFDEDLFRSPAYQRALAASKGVTSVGDNSQGNLKAPERISVIQQRAQDHAHLMKEKLDVAYKENLMAAEREKLYQEELQKSLEETEATSMPCKSRFILF
jgi:hypothetical protein